MSVPEDPRPGLVLRYAYLWKREDEAGILEGRKDRPSVVVLARRDLGPSRVIYVALISHASPAQPQEAVAIPPIVKRHLGLDDDSSFIWATELNVFVWPGPDLRPVPSRKTGSDGAWVYGYLPRGLFRALTVAIEQNRRSGALRR